MRLVNLFVILFSAITCIYCNSIFIENVPNSYCIISYGDRQVLKTNDSRIVFQEQPKQGEKTITLITLNGQNITFKTSLDTPTVDNHPGCNYGLVLHRDNIPAVTNSDKNHGCNIYNLNYLTNDNKGPKVSTNDNTHKTTKQEQVFVNTNSFTLPNRENIKPGQVPPGNDFNKGIKTNVNTHQTPKVTYKSALDQPSYNPNQHPNQYPNQHPNQHPNQNKNYIQKPVQPLCCIIDHTRPNNYPKHDTNINYNTNYNPNINLDSNYFTNESSRITHVKDSSVIVYTFVNKATKPLYPAFSINTTHNYILDSILGYLMPNQVRLYSFDGYWKSLIINPNSSIQCGFYDPFEFIFTDCDSNVKKINRNRVYTMTKERSCIVREN